MFNQSSRLTVHIVGKEMAFLADKYSTVKRLVVCISGPNVSKVLGAPIVADNCGKTHAECTFAELSDWEILELVDSICCDTPWTNTGHNKGAILELMKLLPKKILVFACRRHVYELVVKGAISGILPASKIAW